MQLKICQLLNRCSLLLIFLALSLTSVNAQKSIKVSAGGQSFTHTPRTQTIKKSNTTCNAQEVNRSYNGTCNNISSPSAYEYGATDTPLRRLMANSYSDGKGEITSSRPNVRWISNTVHAQSSDIPSPFHTAMVYTWGQFIDHDIDLTPETEEEMTIPLPDDEPLFTDDMHAKRSMVDPRGGSNSERNQVNIITAWIDASNVYGSDSERADWLRTMEGGKLKASRGNLLPFNTTTGEYEAPIDPTAPSMAGDNDHTRKLWVAGDVRAGEQPGLTALHTLFLREHNRIAETQANNGKSDEEIYQYARKIVGAIIQAITYEEFLPALGVRTDIYRGYDSSVDPTILNIFSTAGYRFGHTMVPDVIEVRQNDGQTTQLQLKDAFFNPRTFLNTGVGPLLNGLSNQAQQKIDNFMVDGLRNFLFPIPGSNVQFGLDLASLNLQRGRDHGLPDYKTVRKYLLDQKIVAYSDINPDPEVTSRLNTAYSGNVDNIDLWTGLLSEDHSCCRTMGQTMHKILQLQFEALRSGDYYFYKNDPSLTQEQKNEIEESTLTDIIKNNTDISNIRASVFELQ